MRTAKKMPWRRLRLWMNRRQLRRPSWKKKRRYVPKRKKREVFCRRFLAGGGRPGMRTTERRFLALFLDQRLRFDDGVLAREGVKGRQEQATGAGFGGDKTERGHR